jgi:hypothetical protein
VEARRAEVFAGFAALEVVYCLPLVPSFFDFSVDFVVAIFADLRVVISVSIRACLVFEGILIPVLIYSISIVEYLNIDIWILTGLDSLFGRIDTNTKNRVLIY